MAAAVQKTVWETESAFMAQWHPIPNIRNVHTDHWNLWHVLVSHGAEDVYYGILGPQPEGKYLEKYLNRKSIYTKALRESDTYPVYAHLALVCVGWLMCLDGTGRNISNQLLLSLHEGRVHSLFLAA